MTESTGSKRRCFLKGLGILAGVSAAGGAELYRRANNYEDSDGDGLSDELEQSEEFHNYLEDVYGDQFEGLDPNRKDLLIDARYVGDASVSDETKNYVEELFQDNGIHLHWLDHPAEYDEQKFEEAYGNDVNEMLGPIDSFYDKEIDEELKTTAIQAVILPNKNGKKTVQNDWKIFESKEEQQVAGISVGNRLAVPERKDVYAEIKILLHEIGHLNLCHAYNDPENTGVMGIKSTEDHKEHPEAELDYTEQEWDKMRNNLNNIRNTTGVDHTVRSCSVDKKAEELQESTQNGLENLPNKAKNILN